MKILYIGYYKEDSDWGRYTTNNILALEKAGINVVCRPLLFSGKQTPPIISHLEKKSTEDCDICIQHVFPEHIVGSKTFKKNIGILANEFLSIDHSTWVESLDQLDQIWVASQTAKNLLPKKLKEKTVVVPNCFIKEHYTTKYPDVDIPQARDKFKFYTIASSSSEALESILKAFHSEFDKTDNVTIIFQTEGNEDVDDFHRKRLEIKSKLAINKNINSYVEDLVIPTIRDQKTLFQLHQYGDCYISASNQRCLQSHVFDAMCFGSNPIVVKNTDSVEYVGEDNAINSVYTINENKGGEWDMNNNSKNFSLKLCEKDLRLTMRKIYDEWLANPIVSVQHRKNGIKKANDFSTQTVGKIMKEVLNA